MADCLLSPRFLKYFPISPFILYYCYVNCFSTVKFQLLKVHSQFTNYKFCVPISNEQPHKNSLKYSNSFPLSELSLCCLPNTIISRIGDSVEY